MRFLLALWLAAGAYVGWTSLTVAPVGPGPLPWVEVAPRLSGDGRFLAFEAVRGERDRIFGRRDSRFTDVVLYDLEEERGEVVSLTPEGRPGNGSSFRPDLSRDGGALVFASEASDLDPDGQRLAATSIFVRERGRALRQVLPPSRTRGTSSSFDPTVDPRGRLVAWPTAGLRREHRERGRGLLVAGLQQGGAWPVPRLNHPSGPIYGRASFGPDGRHLAFSSFARLPLGIGEPGIHVFRVGLDGRRPELLSATPDGRPGNGPSYSPSLALEHCAFSSLASDLVPADDNRRYDVFVRDLARDRTVRETPGNDSSFEPALSADGRWLAFSSYASDLVAGDDNGTSDVFLKDRRTGAVRLVSRGLSGRSGNGPSYAPCLSADGRRLAFATRATDLEAEPVPPGQVYWFSDGDLHRVRADRIGRP